MAPWKTSTAGSARSTSTNSNRRQACLEAALRGGFLISPPLPAQTRDIVRHSSLPLHLTGFAMRSLGGVQLKSKKNEHRRHAISHGLGRKMPHSKPVSAFEFTPDECQHLFIPKTLHRKAAYRTNNVSDFGRWRRPAPIFYGKSHPNRLSHSDKKCVLLLTFSQVA